MRGVKTTIQQGTPEWYATRAGRVTASSVGDLITSTGKLADNDTSRKELAWIALESRWGKPRPSVKSWQMEYGKEREAYILEWYEKHNEGAESGGFWTFGDWCSVSPDAEVWQGFELVKIAEFKTVINAPDFITAKNHLKNGLGGLKKWNSGYHWQVCLQAYVCGVSEVDFVIHNEFPTDYEAQFFCVRLDLSENPIEPLISELQDAWQRTILELE